MTKKILHTWTLNDSNDSKNKSTNEKKVVQLTNWIKFKLNKTKLSNEQKKIIQMNQKIVHMIKRNCLNDQRNS